MHFKTSKTDCERHHRTLAARLAGDGSDLRGRLVQGIPTHIGTRDVFFRRIEVDMHDEARHGFRTAGGRKRPAAFSKFSLSRFEKRNAHPGRKLPVIADGY